MKINTKSFEELTNTQLYQILKLRYDIFVFEQQSIFDEYDGKDYKAYHVFAEEDDGIIAYLRAFPGAEGELEVGRVCVRKDYRGKGIARELMQKILEFADKKTDIQQIKLSSQEYLVPFYKEFGFNEISDVYDDAGVPHVDMVKS